jgi:hypothetical protein
MMKRPNLPRSLAGLVLAAAALVLGATWLIAGANSPQSTAPAEATPQASESTQSPLPDFQPSEQLPAGSAVAFPTDI